MRQYIRKITKVERCGYDAAALDCHNRDSALSASDVLKEMK